MDSRWIVDGLGIDQMGILKKIKKHGGQVHVYKKEYMCSCQTNEYMYMENPCTHHSLRID